jgi:hypothetical protein
MAPKSYLDVYTEHHGLVSHKWIHYFFIYDRILRRFLEKKKPVRLLEIGVQNGGSLEIWKKYLPQGSEIHGVDIDEKCLNIPFSEGISFHLGNATDKDFFEKTFGDFQFDIIIDDGSHISKDVIQTFEYLFPKLQDGAVYIVEDVHCSYWKAFGGGLRNKKSSIEYFKRLIDSSINRDYIETGFFGKIKKRIGKPKSKCNLEIVQAISQISFFDSICAIDKFYGMKTTSFKNVITGEIALVDKEPTELNITLQDRRNDIHLTKQLFCGK